jgi:16S rRNA (adenine1518-N6/adenine1519-N6)-dimethyltransferase
MFKKEMAERIIAPPGGKVYGVISVLTQAFYHGEYLFTVEPDAFNPPPRVMSGVIRLTRKDDNELGCDHQLFRRVVKQAFSQRRKMLRNTMKIFIPHDELMKDDFFRVRPETLSLEQFVALTNKVEGWIEKED